MMILFIQLQAAMGVGVLLLFLLFFLLCIVFPLLSVWFLKNIRARSERAQRLSSGHKFLSLLEAVFCAAIVTGGIAVTLCWLLYMAMKDMVFM